jgi:hypothetical protein
MYSSIKEFCANNAVPGRSHDANFPLRLTHTLITITHKAKYIPCMADMFLQY